MPTSLHPLSEGESPSPPQPGRRRKTSRREQQRSIDTRQAIMEAALVEFANRGFDGASMRQIGERAKIDFTLITYHFRNKDTLWRAVAETAFDQLLKGWDSAAPIESDLSEMDRLRLEYRAYFDFLGHNPAFHSFMIRTMSGDSARLKWLVDNFLMKIMDRILPQLAAAQAECGLIKGDPNLLYYLLLGGASALYALRGEIALTTGYSTDNKDISEAYWALFESAFFK